MMLEVISVYVVLKVFGYDKSINFLTQCELVVWNLLLVFPKTIAICVAAGTAERAQHLNVLVEKHSNHCSDAVFQEVNCYFCAVHTYVLYTCFFLLVKALSLKMHIRPIIFSCGFFNIDWTLILSIIATITTYMIIFCQFEAAFDA